LPPYEPHADDSEAVPQSLELSKTTDLDPFFERLAQTDAGYEQAITRVVHWGDSVIANDNVTSTLRKQMQRRFGDAGHGFHLLAKPNASYRHRGVRFSTNDGWQRCYIINHCKKDGRYGLGGTTVWSAGGGESRYRTATETSYGRKVSRYEIWYAGEPKGGKIRLRVDDGEPEVIETEAPELEDRLHTIELEDGPHELEVRAAGGGRVRLYGVVMERDVPGVVWDGMAQLGAFTSRMLYFDQDHIRGQIARRDPGLLVFQFGGNDLLLSGQQLPQFKQDFAAVLQEFRSEDDPVACLVVSPVDHGNRRSGRIESDRMVPRITDIQRDVALAEGCAFFDTLAAMGGEGAVARWRRAKPPLISGDLAHLTNPGQGVLGHMIYLALMESYREYRVRTDGPVRFPAGAGSGR
jgi:lysophospholipase L1-like esterase